MAKRKSKRKLAPRPKPRPRSKMDDIEELGDTELISDIYEHPYMRKNPLAKLGLYGLLEDGELKSRGRKPLPIVLEDRGPSYYAGKYITSSLGVPIRYRRGDEIPKKGYVAIRTPEGYVHWRHPKDLSMAYQPDTTYINVNPTTRYNKSRTLDRIKRKPPEPTSHREGLIDTIIHELMHRGFRNTPTLRNVGEDEQHEYIAEKQEVALSPDEIGQYWRKRYEPKLQKDKQTAKFIRDKMPSLYAGPYKYEEHTEPPGIMTRLWKALLK
tara:strand:+ start:131 stop:934 length:804 start_codon:yes stop_codon:yes gene_type:complete